jgi:quercetin dioxygenase-like cupin family protein
MADATLYDLQCALADVCRGEGRAAADRTAEILLASTSVDLGSQATVAPFPAEMAALLSASPHPAAAPVLAGMSRLPWGTNPVISRTSARVAEICTVATLMSPEGPIHAENLRLGLFYQRPFSYYPLHNHDADETYVILAGRAFWTAGEDRRMRDAGEYIHHPSLMGHAFRTGAEGFLALWRWSGDVNTHSYAFLPDDDFTES